MPGAPLTDPGVQYSRTGLFNPTRCLSPTGRFASLAPSFSRNWLPVWTSSGCQPLRPSRGLRLAMTYYELIRLPGRPLPLLLVVETAYPEAIWWLTGRHPEATLRLHLGYPEAPGTVWGWEEPGAGGPPSSGNSTNPSAKARAISTNSNSNPVHEIARHVTRRKVSRAAVPALPLGGSPSILNRAGERTCRTHLFILVNAKKQGIWKR